MIEKGKDMKIQGYVLGLCGYAKYSYPIRPDIYIFTLSSHVL